MRPPRYRTVNISTNARAVPASRDRRATTVAGRYGFSTGTVLLNESSPELVSDARVGLEFELEGLNRSIRHYNSDSDVNKYYDVVSDGSLRGSSAEFVFKEPMFGKDVVNALEIVQEKTGEAIFSIRTSVHVHLDVRDMSFDQLVRLVCVYLLVEPIFFEVGGQERSFNPYCTPLRTLNSYLRHISSCMMPSIEGNYSDVRGNGNKYTALNLNPVATQGSIEFRHHEGTNDKAKTLQWINMILSLKSYAMQTDSRITLQEIDSMVDEFDVLVNDLFTGILPKENLNTYIDMFHRDAGLCAKDLVIQNIKGRNPQGLNESSVNCRMYTMFSDSNNHLLKDVVKHFGKGKKKGQESVSDRLDRELRRLRERDRLLAELGTMPAGDQIDPEATTGWLNTTDE